MRSNACHHDVVVLVAVQVLSATASVVVGVVAVGWFGIGPAALALFAASFAWMRRQARLRPDWGRADIRTLSLRAALAHGLLAAAAYAAIYAWRPALFEFPPAGLLVAAPAMGGLAGLVALMVTLSAGDAAGPGPLP